MQTKLLIYISLLMLANRLSAQKPVLDLTKMGAVPDGKTLNTTSIQRSIDSCSSMGGGVVFFPKGVFLSGSIRLRSNVELFLDEGAVLLGSTRFEDYGKNNWYALILALGEHDIAVKGKGSIDGQGFALAQDVDRLYKEGKLQGPYWDNRPHEQHRPQLIDFESCIKVFVSGVTLKNAACWVQRYGRCEDLTITGVQVESMAYWNNDGIDLVDCKRVKVTHCNINSADDGICLKSDRPALACEDIVISDCTVRSSASAVKFGTNSYGGFKRIKIQRIKIFDTFRSAVALEIVDGGVMENILIEDIDAQNTGNAFFIRLGHRNQKVPPGRMHNIHIKNMKVSIPEGKPDQGYPFEGPLPKLKSNILPASIVGLPGHNIENVRLEKIEIEYPGGGTATIAYADPKQPETIPERPKDYPEFSMFGELPAWALFFKHTEGLKIKSCIFTRKKSDYRPAIIHTDSPGLQRKKIRINEDVNPN